MAKQPKDSSVWHCPECNIDIDHDAFIPHLKDKHGIIEMKGTRQMDMHVDGSDFVSSIYTWTIGGKTFTQTITQKRRGQNARNWR
jgi:hypothetical protein